LGIEKGEIRFNSFLGQGGQMSLLGGQRTGLLGPIPLG